MPTVAKKCMPGASLAYTSFERSVHLFHWKLTSLKFLYHQMLHQVLGKGTKYELDARTGSRLITIFRSLGGGGGRRGGLLKTPSRNRAAASQILCCELFVRVLWFTLLMIRLMPATLYAQ